MIISSIILWPTYNPHALPVDIGRAIKPIPVKDKVKELDFVAIITNVSKDFNM